MLKRLRVHGFKSLRDVEIELPRMAVLFGPNAAGKSNVIDAIQALSRLGTERTVADALSGPIRGYPIEALSFPSGGMPELLQQDHAEFSLGGDLVVGKETYRYELTVGIAPDSGKLRTMDEYLALLTAKGNEKGNPAIQRVGDNLHIRRKSKPAHPRQEPVGLNHTILSDPRLGGQAYRWIEKARGELADWRTYYLDPRVAMRAAKPPSDVRDIGVLGGDIAPFLYKLKAESGKHFDAVRRTLTSIIPGVEALDVDLDQRRGTLDLVVRQNGVDFSSRIISEGTLRVLALCAIAANPWGGSLIAFEEPENGVHPRRLELIAELLLSLAVEQGRQVVVTTHSPIFCDAVLKSAQKGSSDVGLFNVRRRGQETVIEPFDVTGALFRDREIADALTSRAEDGLFNALVLRGLLDE
jgi:Predicted ATPase